jgi:bifunctional non-homologous end joining protein LigD
MKRLPRIAPLKLTHRKEPFDHHDWLFELKHDGFRAVAYISDRQCWLISRRDNAYKSFNDLRESLAGLPVTNAILDGEIVCLDRAGKSVFKELLLRKGRPRFYAFDLLWLDGEDLRKLSLVERKNRLKRLVKRSKNRSLLFADHINGRGADLYQMICEGNLEGIVAKRRNSKYSASAKWIKIKNPTYTQSEGRHELFDSRKARIRPKR